MVDALATTLTVVATVLGVVLLVLGGLNRTPAVGHVLATAVLELGMLGQVVVAVVLLIDGPRPVQLATFIGYLIASLVILPLVAAWAWFERTKWGTVVLGVGCLVIAVLILRLRQVWEVRGG